MKGATYIVKRPYFEKNQQKEYDSHLERMKKIKGILNLEKNFKQISVNMQKSNSAHQKAFKFKEVQKSMQEKVVNKALINKLLDISDGKFSTIIKQISQTNFQINNTNQSIQQQQNVQQPEMFDTNQDTQQSQKKRQRVLSDLNASRKLQKQHLQKQSLQNVVKKREIDRIAFQNSLLAQRMITLPSIIKKSQLDQQYKEQQKLKNLVRKFHQTDYSNQSQSQYLQRVKTEEDNPQKINDSLDENDLQLMNEKVHVVIKFNEIIFSNFYPLNSQEEKYFLVIRACHKIPRETTPEIYMDFSKTVINEFFYVKELKKSKIIYIGLYQKKEQKDQQVQKARFLADFKLDLTKYYKKSCNQKIKLDLFNFKELQSQQNNNQINFKNRKGSIEFEIVIKSNVQILQQNHFKSQIENKQNISENPQNNLNQQQQQEQ